MTRLVLYRVHNGVAIKMRGDEGWLLHLGCNGGPLRYAKYTLAKTGRARHGWET